MISGDALNKLLEPSDGGEPRRDFVDAATVCEVVIAGRVTPLQKAKLLQMVRENVTVPGITKSPVTLAIGDGANDVPLIQSAQVGIGIFGKEGRQAVNNSDFAIHEFKHLKRLLLVHGRYNYRRASMFVLFTFWRNAVQVTLLAIFNYYATGHGRAAGLRHEPSHPLRGCRQRLRQHLSLCVRLPLDESRMRGGVEG